MRKEKKRKKEKQKEEKKRERKKEGKTSKRARASVLTYHRGQRKQPSAVAR